MTQRTHDQNEPMTEATRQRLRKLRGALLHLHKALLDDERAAYERLHGRKTSGEMLQLVIHDEQFAWLRPISELIVRIDEMLDSEETGTAASASNLIAQTRALLVPGETGDTFGQKYYAALQNEPDVVLMHREVMLNLSTDV